MGKETTKQVKKSKDHSKTTKKNPLLIMGLIGGVIVLVFGAMILLQNIQHSKALKEYNPYGDKDISAPTKDLLSNKNYQNIILPEDLDKRITSGEPTTVYFFSPTCQFCKETTPIIAPMAKEMGIDLVQYNAYEFGEGFTKYGIQATPTIVHFVNGKEIGRVVGSQTKDSFEKWFKSIKVN